MSAPTTNSSPPDPRSLKAFIALAECGRHTYVAPVQTPKKDRWTPRRIGRMRQSTLDGSPALSHSQQIHRIQERKRAKAEKRKQSRLGEEARRRARIAKRDARHNL